jgi:hypothetical protein
MRGKRTTRLSGGEAGFTFNELLATIGIVAVFVLGYTLSSVNLFRRQVISDNSTVAIHLAQDKIEELQARRPLGDDNSCPTGGERGLSAKAGVAGLFDRCWQVAASPLGSGLKQIDVTVSWRDHEDHRVTLSTLIFTGE